MDSDWDKREEATLEEIVSVLLDIRSRYSLEQSEKIKQEIKSVNVKFSKLKTSRMKSIKKKYDTELKKLENEFYENKKKLINEYNSVLIKDIQDEFNINFNPSLSFMLSSIYYGLSCDSALELLKNQDFKDQHHHKGERYDSLKSFKEYMDVAKNSFMKALKDEGIGKNNATRISTKLTTKLKNELKSKLNL